jgi:hypothetical protein
MIADARGLPSRWLASLRGLRFAARGVGVTADQLLTALFNAGIAISVGATVLSLGMTFTVGQLVS